jgi:DNA adenine methylase
VREAERPTTTPFLRWAGSKRQLVPVLKTYWKSSHERYLEPFAGSACLFFSLSPERAILGDLNADLISTYREVKYRHHGILSRLLKLRRSKWLYSKLRATDPAKLGASARAARFIYLNRYCFNGLYRTNLQGEFNVPYGGAGTGTLPSPDHLRDCANRLRRTRLVSGDFEKVLKHAKRGDFVYIDPPFAIRSRRVFNEYDPATFGVDDIKRLRVWMERLARRRIAFVVSYAESEEADVLRKGFDSQAVSVRRNIAGFVAHRSASKEILISNV